MFDKKTQNTIKYIALFFGVAFALIAYGLTYSFFVALGTFIVSSVITGIAILVILTLIDIYLYY